MNPIHFDFCATSFGEILAARSSAGLCHLSFTDGDRAVARADLARRWPGRRFVRADLTELTAGLFANGSPVWPDFELLGTPFQRAVWQAVLQIPRGSTIAYGELARRLGRPRSARAVGRAVGSNCLAVVVPCHRVVPRAGGPGHYRWGRQRKAALLAWEAACPA
jgi:AraC family transcriptional regulator of adaptative response/methylated-DNA-[protein]-cysteine methyltransferase